MPWYNLGSNSVGAQYTNAVTSTWNGSNYFSPITFVHDYTLDNFHGTGASTYANACKIRVGITFYPVLVDTLTESKHCLLYTSPSPRDLSTSRMPSSA